jgi:hypothetical protein
MICLNIAAERGFVDRLAPAKGDRPCGLVVVTGGDDALGWGTMAPS